jgi:uncharacterized protein (TIGR04222 family)
MVRAVQETLALRGLVHDAAEGRRLAARSSVALWLLAAAGAARAYLDHARGHPVGSIVAPTLITLLAAMAMAGLPPRTRQAGRDAVRQWRERQPESMLEPAEGETPMAVALAGAAILSGTPFDALARFRATQAGLAAAGETGLADPSVRDREAS